MPEYTCNHSWSLAITKWPQPLPNPLPVPGQLRDACAAAHPKLDSALATLNSTPITALDVTDAKKKAIAGVTGALAPDYRFVGDVSSYIAMKDEDGTVIGHTVEKYLVDPNNAPLPFTFEYQPGYRYFCYLSVKVMVMEADYVPLSVTVTTRRGRKQA